MEFRRHYKYTGLERVGDQPKVRPTKPLAFAVLCGTNGTEDGYVTAWNKFGSSFKNP
jgi:hypothetical protein